MKLNYFKKSLQQSIDEKKRQNQIKEFEETICQYKKEDGTTKNRINRLQSLASEIKAINEKISQKYQEASEYLPTHNAIFKNIIEAYNLYLKNSDSDVKSFPLSKFINKYSQGEDQVEEIKNFIDGRNQLREDIPSLKQDKKDVSSKFIDTGIRKSFNLHGENKWNETPEFIKTVNKEIDVVQGIQKDLEESLHESQYDQICEYFIPEKSQQLRYIIEGGSQHTPEGIKIKCSFDIKYDHDFTKYTKKYGEDFTKYLLYRKLSQKIDREVEQAKREIQIDDLQLMINEHGLWQEQYQTEVENSQQVKNQYQECLDLLNKHIGPDPKREERESTKANTLEKYLHKKYGIEGRIDYENIKDSIRKFLQLLVKKQIDFQNFASSWNDDKTELESYLAFTPGSDSRKTDGQYGQVDKHTDEYISNAMGIEYKSGYQEDEVKLCFLNLTATQNANQVLSSALGNIINKLKNDNIEDIINYVDGEDNEGKNVIDAKTLNHYLSLRQENINILFLGRHDSTPQDALDQLKQAIETERQTAFTAVEVDLNKQFNQAHLEYLKNYTDAEKLYHKQADYEAKIAKIEKNKDWSEKIINSVKELTKYQKKMRGSMDINCHDEALKYHKLLMTKVAIKVDKHYSDKKYTIYNHEISQQIEETDTREVDYEKQISTLNDEINSLQDKISNASWWNGLWHNSLRQEKIETKQSAIDRLNTAKKECQDATKKLNQENKQFEASNPQLKELISSFDGYCRYFEHEGMKDISELSELAVSEILVKIKETIKEINSPSVPEFSEDEKELLEKFRSLEQITKNNPDQK